MNNHTTVYIGMDVHKESFTLSSFVLGKKNRSTFRRYRRTTYWC